MGDRAKLQKHVVTLLEDVGRNEGMRTLEVFERFLEVAYRAIRGKTVAGAAWQENEAHYERVYEGLQRPDEAKTKFAEVLALVTIALNNQCADFLGPLWMEIGSSASLGQFFTPHEVSKLIAGMTLGDINKMIAETGRPYFTAQEPTAGMGGMVLAMAELMLEQGLDPSINCFIHMIELDYSVYRGCYIQTSLAGIAGAAFHGDTIRMSMISSAHTPAALQFMAAHGVPKFGAVGHEYDHTPKPEAEKMRKLTPDL